MSKYDKWAGGGTFYYGDWWKKGGLVSSSGTKSTSSDYYRSKYKSSLGYSSGLGRSGWYGSYYGAGASYSSVSSGDFESAKVFLQRVSKAARDLVVILDFPFNVKIDFTGKLGVVGDPKTRRIFVPTNIFNDEKTSEEEKVSLFCSLAIHEAAHLKYTEQRTLRKFLTEVVPIKYRTCEEGLIKMISLLIEDERIEDFLLRERPGYLEFIEREKNYQYKTFSESVTEDITKKKYLDFFTNLVKLIRFPEHIDSEVFEKYKDVYTKIGSELLPLPDSTKGVCTAAETIFKCIKDSGIPTDAAETRDFNSAMNEIYKLVQDKISYEVLYGSDGDSGINGNSSLTSTAIKKIGESAMRLITNLIDGTAASGSKKDTYFSIAEGDSTRYMDSVKRVSRYIPHIKKLIAGHDKNYDFTIHGCRNGLLDTSKLAEAYQGVPQVYLRKGTVRTNKTTVCILIDESGSMGWGRKITTARDTAVLLNEAFKTLPGVDLYIYGHSGDIVYSGATELRIYKEGRSKEISKFALGSVDARSENRDGTAIYETARRVRKFTDGSVLMFIISDGAPAADNYYGYEARQDVKKNIAAVENMGFTTIAITIDSYREAREMYPRNVDLSSDLSTFPKRLAQIVKKLVIQDKKTTIIQ